jgi:hypothetical protein
MPIRDKMRHSDLRYVKRETQVTHSIVTTSEVLQVRYIVEISPDVMGWTGWEDVRTEEAD